MHILHTYAARTYAQSGRWHHWAFTLTAQIHIFNLPYAALLSYRSPTDYVHFTTGAMLSSSTPDKLNSMSIIP